MIPTASCSRCWPSPASSERLSSRVFLLGNITALGRGWRRLGTRCTAPGRGCRRDRCGALRSERSRLDVLDPRADGDRDLLAVVGHRSGGSAIRRRGPGPGLRRCESGETARVTGGATGRGGRDRDRDRGRPRAVALGRLHPARAIGDQQSTFRAVRGADGSHSGPVVGHAALSRGIRDRDPRRPSPGPTHSCEMRCRSSQRTARRSPCSATLRRAATTSWPRGSTTAGR